MSLFITSLNSGSNGNCYYIGNNSEAVLIDAGLGCRELERRMGRLGLDTGRVKAVFITHEHTDHIRGLEAVTAKYEWPVYITARTLHNSRLQIAERLLRAFSAQEAVSIGGLTVQGFPKYHDAADPHSFTVSGNGVHVGIFTDIGRPCDHLVRHFRQCHAAFLEANYDEAMLDGGRYPHHLKNRIRGGRGHLSNRQALELFVQHRPAYMSHLFLAHLSQENNCPDVARQLFAPHAGHTQVIVATRHEETPVYTIVHKAAPAEPQLIMGKRRQLCLF